MHPVLELERPLVDQARPRSCVIAVIVHDDGGFCTGLDKTPSSATIVTITATTGATTVTTIMAAVAIAVAVAVAFAVAMTSGFVEIAGSFSFANVGGFGLGGGSGYDEIWWRCEVVLLLE